MYPQHLSPSFSLPRLHAFLRIEPQGAWEKKLGQCRSSLSEENAVLLDVSGPDEPNAMQNKAAFLLRVHEIYKESSQPPRTYLRLPSLIQEGSVLLLENALTLSALEGVMVHCSGPADLDRLSVRLGVGEVRKGLEIGRMRIFIMPTYSADAVFQLGRYCAVCPRLAGFVYQPGALFGSGRAGSRTAKNAKKEESCGRIGNSVETLIRNLCILGAHAADVALFRGEKALNPTLSEDILLEELCQAYQGGFSGQILDNPAHLALSNSVFAR